MSLNWDVTNIKDYKTLCWIPEPTKENPEQVRINPTTEALIWATMNVGIGDLSEKNLDEFAYRLFFYEKNFQTFLNSQDGPVPLTYEDLKAHIGLRTNVSFETRTKWATAIKNTWFREASWAAQRALDSAKKPKLELVQ